MSPPTKPSSRLAAALVAVSLMLASACSDQEMEQAKTSPQLESGAVDSQANAKTSSETDSSVDGLSQSPEEKAYQESRAVFWANDPVRGSLIKLKAELWILRNDVMSADWNGEPLPAGLRSEMDYLVEATTKLNAESRRLESRASVIQFELRTDDSQSALAEWEIISNRTPNWFSLQPDLVLNRIEATVGQVDDLGIETDTISPLVDYLEQTRRDFDGLFQQFALL